MSALVTAMENAKPVQKSHLIHVEEHEPDLDANKWISQFQRMMYELPYNK